MKTCSTCGIEKLESEFSPDGKHSGKLRNSCKTCNCAATKRAYAKNPERVKSRSRRRHADHREDDNKKALVRYYNNREANIARHVAYKKRRYAEESGYRIGVGLSNRINKVLRGVGGVKSARTLELLGCPVVWLEAHLESLFQSGMTWENYGPMWHVDHIKPCAAFDLTDPEQQKICFHWTNLQPLFAIENLQKGDKYAAAN